MVNFRRIRPSLRPLGFGLAATLATTCSPVLRTAPSGLPSDGSEAVMVAYPPPPAEVQHLGADPGPPCAWVDGHWRWLGRRWQWAHGGWFVPPEGCVLSRPVLAWVPTESGGALYYWQPRWFRQSGAVGAGCDAPKPCGTTGPPPGSQDDDSTEDGFSGT